MAEQTRGDWRPPTDDDWRRLRTLLRDVMIHLRTDAEMFDQAEQDLRAVGGAMWPGGIGRYPERAERCREMAIWVEDEYHAVEGNHQRKVQLDDRGMFSRHGGAMMVPQVRWENLEDRDHRCPQCLHWWVSHGVPTEDDYACGMPASSMDERGAYEICGCTFAEGNPVTPRQVRSWQDGTSWPLAPNDRADCGHQRRGRICPDDFQQCLDCGVVFVSDG